MNPPSVSPCRPCYGTVIIVFLISFTCLGNVGAVDGTVIESGVGIWTPLLPTFEDGVSDSGDSIGTILSFSGHHRFDKYRTSVEAGVDYGISDSAEVFAYEFLLRDTWAFGIGDLSAGTGYSSMQWTQDFGDRRLISDYVGGKVIGGWETIFGRQPVWIDLTLGLYDLDAQSQGSLDRESIDRFTTTWSIDCKLDCETFGIPMRTVIGVDYLHDIARWREGRLSTDDAVVLTAGLEFRLY